MFSNRSGVGYFSPLPSVTTEAKENKGARAHSLGHFGVSSFGAIYMKVFPLGLKHAQK